MREPHFVEREAVQLAVGDAPGQRFGALSQQLGRGAAKHQEVSPAGPAIGEHPQHREQLRTVMNLVDDDEAAELFERQHRVAEEREVAGQLEIEADGRTPRRARHLPGQRRLSHLPRAEESDDRELGEQRSDAQNVCGSLEH